MIAPEQLTAALASLDPRDWEVLDLSLRRRVPDDALAQVLGVETAEVARRRAAAIERLSDDLEIQRGEDLGHVLKALLEEETWSSAEAQSPGRDPVVAEPASAPTAPPAVPVPPPEGEGPRTLRRVLVGVGAAVLLLGVAGGAAAVVLSGGSDDGSEQDNPGSETRSFVPQAGGPLAAPFPSDPNVSFSYLTARLRRTTKLYSRPGGRRKLRLRAHTEWGSPRILSVVRERGPWLGVVVSELPNGNVGWVKERAVRLGSVNWALDVDRSRRELVVRRNDHAVRSMPIAVGGPGHSTPVGRFAVTDKLRVRAAGSPYGCCVLALSGHQTHLPPDWPGGDRLAIHATNDAGSIGRAVSLGCMRARPAEGRWLLRNVPVGTPVFIRR